FAFRCTRGAFSNIKGEEITPADFHQSYPAWLQRECERAIDCPRDNQGNVNRLLLFKVLTAELKGLWAVLIEKLPTEEAAYVGSTSPAAKRFKRILTEVLTDYPTQHHGTMPIIDQIRRDADNHLSGKLKINAKEKWNRVRFFDAWWKPILVHDRP